MPSQGFRAVGARRPDGFISLRPAGRRHQPTRSGRRRLPGKPTAPDGAGHDILAPATRPGPVAPPPSTGGPHPTRPAIPRRRPGPRRVAPVGTTGAVWSREVRGWPRSAQPGSRSDKRSATSWVDPVRPRRPGRAHRCRPRAVHPGKFDPEALGRNRGSPRQVAATFLPTTDDAGRTTTARPRVTAAVQVDEPTDGVTDPPGAPATGATGATVTTNYTVSHFAVPEVRVAGVSSSCAAQGHGWRAGPRLSYTRRCGCSSAVAIQLRLPGSRAVAVGNDAGRKPRNSSEAPEMAGVGTDRN